MHLVSNGLAHGVRVLVVGGRHFSRPLGRALSAVSSIETVDFAETIRDAVRIARLLKPDVVLVEPAFANAAAGICSTASVVVLAPSVAETANEDEATGGFLPAVDLAMAAIVAGVAAEPALGGLVTRLHR